MATISDVEQRKKELRSTCPAGAALSHATEARLKELHDEVTRAAAMKLVAPAATGQPTARGAASAAASPAATAALCLQGAAGSAPAMLAQQAGSLEVAAEAWEATWEENQAELERNINILNDDCFLAEVVNQGTNLQNYAVEKDDALRDAEAAAIEEYVENGGEFEDLYSSLSECEAMLDGIRGVVWGFREHLGSITGDIKHLQKRSAVLTERIRNRQGALLHLAPVLQKVDVISPEWLRSLETMPIEAPNGLDKVERQRDIETAFVSALKQLDEKVNFLAEDPHLQESQMQQELYPKLMSTAGKVALRAHTFLNMKMNALREDTNIVIHQQALAHRCSFAFRFLRAYNSAASEAVTNDYVEKINKVHLKAMKKVCSDSATEEVKLSKPDLIVPKDTFNAKKGVEKDGDSKPLFGKIKEVAQRDRMQLPFPERERILSAVLPDGDQLVIDPSVMITQKRTYVEDIVRVTAELVNSAVHEVSFVAEFFNFPSAKREVCRRICPCICARAIFPTQPNLVSHRLSLTPCLRSPSCTQKRRRPIFCPKQRVIAWASCCCFGCMCIAFSLCAFHTPPPFPTARSACSATSFPRRPQLKQTRTRRRYVSCSLCISTPLPAPPKQSSLMTSRANATRGTAGECIALRSQSRTFRPPAFLVGHLKDVQARLWTMYSDVMAANLASVQEAATIKFAQVKTGDKSTEELMRAGGQFAHLLGVHSTVRRYVEVACDVHVLNTRPMLGSRVSGAAHDSTIFSDAIVSDLSSLHRQALAFITSLSRRFKAKSHSCIFLINNLSSVLEIMTERGASDENRTSVETLLRADVAVFAKLVCATELPVSTIRHPTCAGTCNGVGPAARCDREVRY